MYLETCQLENKPNSKRDFDSEVGPIKYHAERSNSQQSGCYQRLDIERNEWLVDNTDITTKSSKKIAILPEKSLEKYLMYIGSLFNPSF